MPHLGVIGDVTETGRSGGGFYFDWRIPDFLSLAGEIGDRYESPVFNAGNERWFIKVYPYGLWGKKTSVWVSLFLIRINASPAKTFNITLGIRGLEGVENTRERSQKFFRDNFACCWLIFCTRSYLREQESRLMPENVLVFTLDIKSNIVKDSYTQTVEESKDEVEVATEENQSLENQGVEELLKSLHGLLEGGENSDVLIEVRGKEFPAHRAILGARSPIFQAMFTHDMVEKQSGKVTMEDCDPESFPAFLEHVYTGSTNIISIGNVFSLYTAADKYDLGALKKACTKFVKNNLSVSCFCNAITLSVKHDEKELIECATEFFCNNALEIMKTVDWQTFLKENSTVGNELLIKTISKYDNKNNIEE